MQMAVQPAHRILNCDVEIPESIPLGHLNSTPDQRIRPWKDDQEWAHVVDFRDPSRLRRLGHQATWSLRCLTPTNEPRASPTSSHETNGAPAPFDVRRHGCYGVRFRSPSRGIGIRVTSSRVAYHPRLPNRLKDAVAMTIGLMGSIAGHPVREDESHRMKSRRGSTHGTRPPRHRSDDIRCP